MTKVLCVLFASFFFALASTGTVHAQFEQMMIIGASDQQEPASSAVGGSFSNTTNAASLFSETSAGAHAETSINPLFASNPMYLILMLMQQNTSTASASTSSTSSGAPAYSSNYSSIKSAISTPQQAVSYMSANFNYSFHNGNVAYSPSDFNSSKSGDCKDFAVFMGDVLSDDSIEVKPITVKYDTSSWHVMTVTNYNGHSYLQSNQQIWDVASNDQILQISNDILPGDSVSNLRYWAPGTTNFSQ
jgi:hypothetical protein